jgi:glycosyltransferase involved in cell wall biosynthesis
MVGGAELCLDTTLRHLDRSRYEAHVVFPWDGPMAEAARNLGMPVDLVPLSWWSHWPTSAWYYKKLVVGAAPNLARLTRLIRQRKIDLVYTNSIAVHEPAFAARLANVPHVWHCHEVLRSGRPAQGPLPLWLTKKLIASLAHRIVFESRAARAAFEDGSVCPKARVVYNSVRTLAQPAAGAAAAFRTALGFDAQHVVIGFIGQFIERKNPDFLFRALARLRDHPDWRAVFVGGGPLRAAMAGQVARLGLEARCRLVDFQDDVGHALDAIDVLVLPSREESFGLVLVEAGAFAKPVVATRVEGPSEIVADGVTGFLVEKDDDAALAARLEQLCQDEALRRRMGQAGQKRVQETFSPIDNTRRLEAIIDEALAERAADRKVRPNLHPRVACATDC